MGKTCILVLVVLLMSVSCSVAVPSSTMIVEYGQEVAISCPSEMSWKFIQLRTGKSFPFFWNGVPVLESISIFNENYKFSVDGSKSVLRILSLDENLVGSYQCCSEDGEETCLLFNLVEFLRYKHTSCNIMELDFHGNLSNNSQVINLEKNGEESYSATIKSNEETIQFNFSSEINGRNTSASTILHAYFQNSKCSSPVKETVTRSPLSDGNTLSGGQEEKQSGRIATSSTVALEVVTPLSNTLPGGPIEEQSGRIATSTKALENEVGSRSPSLKITTVDQSLSSVQGGMQPDRSDMITVMASVFSVLAILLVSVACIVSIHKCHSPQQRWKFCIYCKLCIHCRCCSRTKETPPVELIRLQQNGSSRKSTNEQPVIAVNPTEAPLLPV